MSATPTTPPGATPGDSDLTGTYVRVVIVEVLVIAGLYWLGKYFG